MVVKTQRSKPSPHDGSVSVGDERRAALVRAAFDIIAQGGLESLRTRDVADQVGRNVATLHYYFPTKQDLIQAVAFHVAGLFMSVGAKPPSDKAGTTSRLELELADIRLYLSERTEVISVMRELIGRAARDPAISGVMDHLRAGWLASLEEVVTAGIAEGSCKPDLDPRSTGIVMLSMIWGASTFGLQAGDRELVYDAIRNLVLKPQTERN